MVKYHTTGTLNGGVNYWKWITIGSIGLLIFTGAFCIITKPRFGFW